MLHLLVQVPCRHCHVVLKQFLLTQVMEEELNTQAVILETLNTTLYQTQMELQREASPSWRGDGGCAEESRFLYSSTI